MPDAVDLSDLMTAKPASAAPKGAPVSAPGQTVTMSQLKTHLDQKYGAGKYTIYGYRPTSKEDQLRREGAGTVPPGERTDHSLGTPDDPGAYDISVPGLKPAQVEKDLRDSGFAFESYLPEDQHGDQGPHLHVRNFLPASASTPPTKMADGDVDLSDLLKPTPLDKAKKSDANIITAGIAGQKAQAERFAPGPSVVSQVAAAPGQIASRAGSDYYDRTHQAADRLKHDFTDPYKEGRGALPISLQGDKRALDVVGDTLDYLTSPITSAFDTVVGRPVEMATGGRVSKQTAGSVASMAVPLVGEIGGEAALAARARGAGVGVDTLRGAEATRAALPKPNALKEATHPAADETAHAAAVRRLKADGVHPAAHQAAGGGVKRFTEALKSDFHTGPGIRAAEQQANDSFNRALYNKALKPLGEGVSDKAPVGRAGVKDLQQRFDAAYKEAQPHIHVPDDSILTGELSGIRTSVAKLGKPQEQQFEAILNQDVLHHFGPDGLDGATYQSVKSDLLRQSRELRGSSDPNARGLGRALDDVADSLSEAATRGSDPKWRDRISKIDNGYAMLTRIEDAAARRQGGRGEITPQDLLAAAKKGDKRIRRRGFAAGDALLQGFGEDADRVLTPEVRDSGTPERQLAVAAAHGAAAMGAGHIAGIGPELGMAADVAIAPATNALARRLLSRGAPKSPAPTNYLKAAEQRRLGRYAPVVARPPAISDQSQR